MPTRHVTTNIAYRGLHETAFWFATVSSECWYCHVLRREDDDVSV